MGTKFFKILLPLLLIYGGVINAQTGLSSDVSDSLRIYTGSGNNQILVPVPAALQEQNLQISVSSSDSSVLLFQKQPGVWETHLLFFRHKKKETRGKLILPYYSVMKKALIPL
jgi:hypothetical protein